MELPQDVLDFQLSPSRSAKNPNGVLEGMVVATLAAQNSSAIVAKTDISYGPRPRQKLDVYRPNGTDNSLLPCLVFLHGGFWQEGDKSVSGFAAESFATLGWATVAVGYSLTPQVSLTQLTCEINEAIQYIVSHADVLGIDPERIVLAGHSAGGHLAASVLADALGTGLQECIAGAVLISGVFELGPIARSYVNDLTRMSPEELRDLSPLRYKPATEKPVHVLIGSDEPEAFQVQSDVLRETWGPHLPKLTAHIASGRDHFDVLDELNDPASETVRAIQKMIAPNA